MLVHVRKSASWPLLAALVALSSCSKSVPTAPSVGLSSPVGNSPSPLRVSEPAQIGSRLSARPLSSESLDWYSIAESWAYPGQEKIVGGGRYELRFFPGSLAEPALITIHENDSHVLDVQFGPHDTNFGTPVELTIDFSGTTADPGSGLYDGSRPVLYWLNESTSAWEEVPGTTDWEQLKHVIRLEHFSRYILSGKAGW